MASQFKALHIVQGGVENGDMASLENSGKRGKVVDRWMVPKSADVGDELVIYIGGHGFFATATVAGQPYKRTDWQNRYGAAISSVNLIRPPIPIGVIQDAVPEFAWTKYPRSIATPTLTVSAKLRTLVENRRRRHSERPDPAAAESSLVRPPAGGSPNKANTQLVSEPTEEDLRLEWEVFADPKLTQTEKESIVLARRGQGLFRAEVLIVEPRCRVTGVRDPNYLIASHIKPWSESSNEERLSQDNGLMLTPHVDHLFDNGYISFTDVGDLLISRRCIAHVLSAWGIPQELNVRPFRPAQRPFLKRHRQLFEFEP